MEVQSLETASRNDICSTVTLFLSQIPFTLVPLITASALTGQWKKKLASHSGSTQNQ